MDLTRNTRGDEAPQNLCLIRLGHHLYVNVPHVIRSARDDHDPRPGARRP